MEEGVNRPEGSYAAESRTVNRDKTLTALAATVVLWASAFPAIRVALGSYSPAQLSFLRLAVASALLAATAPLLGIRRPALRDLPRVALAGAAGMSAYQLLLNWGEVHVPAGTASLIMATTPAMSAVLAAVFLRESMRSHIIVGSCIALVGTGIIALAGGDTGYSVAAWAILVAAISQALYHLSIKPLLERHTPLEVAAHAMWAGTAFLVPLAPSSAHAVLTASIDASGAVLYLGVLPSAAGFVLWGYAVARLTVTAATAGLYLVPVVALAVSYVWLGERPHAVELLGGALTLAGVALVNRRPSSASLDAGSQGRIEYS